MIRHVGPTLLSILSQNALTVLRWKTFDILSLLLEEPKKPLIVVPKGIPSR